MNKNIQYSFYYIAIVFFLFETTHAKQVSFIKKNNASQIEYNIFYEHEKIHKKTISQVSFLIDRARVVRDNSLIPSLQILAKKINNRLPTIAHNESRSVIESEHKKFIAYVRDTFTNITMQTNAFSYPFRLDIHCPDDVLTYSVHVSYNHFLQRMHTSTCRIRTQSNDAFQAFFTQVSHHVDNVAAQLPVGSQYIVSPQGNGFQIHSTLRATDSTQLQQARYTLAQSTNQIAQWQAHFDMEQATLERLFFTMKNAQKKAMETLQSRTNTVFTAITEKTNSYMNSVYKENFITTTSLQNTLRLQLDYAALFKDSLNATKPIAQAFIQKNTHIQRDRIQDVVYFMQSIPYDTLHGRDIIGYKGFLPPTALIDRNKGDCDSKSVAFLSIIENIYPQLPKVMILIRDHAFVGIELQNKSDDVYIQHKGKKFVIIEPSGPALLPIGTASSQTQKALQKKRIEQIITM